MLDCQCEGLGDCQGPPVQEERDCQLGRQEVTQQEDQLAHWRHVAAPIENVIQDSVLSLASNFVSFVMLKSFHSDK